MITPLLPRTLMLCRPAQTGLAAGGTCVEISRGKFARAFDVRVWRIAMSIVDRLERVTAPKQETDVSASSAESSQLRDLEEVEAILKEIGVTLEPKFDISLAARIGTASEKH